MGTQNCVGTRNGAESNGNLKNDENDKARWICGTQTQTGKMTAAMESRYICGLGYGGPI